jgi:hypothetical protein
MFESKQKSGFLAMLRLQKIPSIANSSELQYRILSENKFTELLVSVEAVKDQSVAHSGDGQAPRKSGEKQPKYATSAKSHAGTGI